MNLPLEAQIWGSQECADYCKVEPPYFLRHTRHLPGFPKELPAFKDGRPRWSAAKVVAWALDPRPREVRS